MLHPRGVHLFELVLCTPDAAMFSSHCNMSHHRCQNTLTPPARAMHLCVSIPAMCTASNPAHFFTTTVKDAAHASESVFLYLPPCCARHRIFPHTHARKAAGAAAAAPKVVTCPADARGAQGFGQKCVPRNRLRSGKGGFLDLKKEIKKPFLAAFCQLERLGLPEQVKW
jgi:hypothetical protein